LNCTKNRTLVTCTLSNLNILHSLRSAFSTGGKFRPVSIFYVVTRSYSSRPFLCALGLKYCIVQELIKPEPLT